MTTADIAELRTREGVRHQVALLELEARAAGQPLPAPRCFINCVRAILPGLAQPFTVHQAAAAVAERFPEHADKFDHVRHTLFKLVHENFELTGSNPQKIRNGTLYRLAPVPPSEPPPLPRHFGDYVREILPTLPQPFNARQVSAAVGARFPKLADKFDEVCHVLFNMTKNGELKRRKPLVGRKRVTVYRIQELRPLGSHCGTKAALTVRFLRKPRFVPAVKLSVREAAYRASRLGFYTAEM